MVQPKKLFNVSAVSVHFANHEDVGLFLSLRELAVMNGSLASVSSEKELFTVISSAMGFPNYFGNNWDALDECLTDMEWLPADGYLLVLTESSNVWTRCPYVLRRFITAWLEAADYWRNNQTPFHVLFTM